MRLFSALKASGYLEPQLLKLCFKDVNKFILTIARIWILDGKMN